MNNDLRLNLVRAISEIVYSVSLSSGNLSTICKLVGIEDSKLLVRDNDGVFIFDEATIAEIFVRYAEDLRAAADRIESLALEATPHTLMYVVQEELAEAREEALRNSWVERES